MFFFFFFSLLIFFFFVLAIFRAFLEKQQRRADATNMRILIVCAPKALSSAQCAGERGSKREEGGRERGRGKYRARQRKHRERGRDRERNTESESF